MIPSDIIFEDSFKISCNNYFQAPGTVGQRPPLFTHAELEECDSTTMEEMFLFRFDGDSNQFSHKVRGLISIIV